MKLKFQIIFIVFVVIVFVITSSVWVGLAALYGGLVSVINVLLLTRHTARQKSKLSSGAQESVRMLFSSLLVRLAMLVLLVAIGFVLLGLDPLALVVGLTVGQVSFLFDSYLVNSLSKVK